MLKKAQASMNNWVSIQPNVAAKEWSQREQNNLVKDLNPGVRKRKADDKGFKNVVTRTSIELSTARSPPISKALSSTPLSSSSSDRGNVESVEDCMDYSHKSYNLSQSQQRALNAIMRRHSVFFTGAAGTGKSYILKILQETMESLKKSNKISLTAPTGVAACNIRGLTIHSWAGIGQGSETIDQLIGIVARNAHACKRWRETEILVIDEISMLSAELFDKLDIIGRRVRNNLAVFGGLQLVLCGDFFQLPPVRLGDSVSFCFEAKAWKELFADHPENIIDLKTVFRQKEDQSFLNLLNELRIGEVSPNTINILRAKVQEAQPLTESLSKQKLNKTIVRPTKLFSTNKDVDAYNLEELQRLADQHENDADTEPRVFIAVDEGREPYMTQLKAGTKAPQSLLLRVGAQVMLLKNLNTAEGLVNGARGTVIGFERSNGRSAHYPMLPIVKFDVIVGSERHEVTEVLPHDTWDVKNGDTILAKRIQIPLMLAWAISIHKSQGMTIPLLEVSFNKMFEYGQGYVALSRATSLKGLTLRSFSHQAIRAHPKVQEFYDELKANTPRMEPDATVTVTIGQFMKVYNGEEAQEVVQMRQHVDHDQWLEARRPREEVRHTTGGHGHAMQAYDMWLEDHAQGGPKAADGESELPSVQISVSVSISIEDRRTGSSPQTPSSCAGNVSVLQHRSSPPSGSSRASTASGLSLNGFTSAAEMIQREHNISQPPLRLQPSSHPPYPSSRPIDDSIAESKVMDEMSHPSPQSTFTPYPYSPLSQPGSVKTIENVSGLSDELKRRIEKNRQEALEKQAKFR